MCVAEVVDDGQKFLFKPVSSLVNHIAVVFEAGRQFVALQKAFLRGVVGCIQVENMSKWSDLFEQKISM